MILYADVGGTNVRAWTEGRGKIDALIVGLRGVWTPAEKNSWKKKFRGVAPRITVFSDIELAHHLAFGVRPGITLNAGTGSIAFGRNSKGATSRAGGLGPLIGDEGSAFWIGREYLKREGRRFPMTPDAVKKIAQYSKTVLKIAARSPKSKEARIVSEAQHHLRKLVAAVRKNLNLPASAPVHLTGGLFESAYFKSRWQKPRSRR